MVPSVAMRGSSLLRLAVVLPLSLFAYGCKDAPAGPTGESSASPSGSPGIAGGDEDLLPAVEISAPRPRYAIADLKDKQVERLVSRAGWTPTVVSKSAPSDPGSTIRVAAIRKTDGKQLETAVVVRCRKQDDRAPPFPPGEAYFRDANCVMDVAVHLGVRNKSDESKRLLEALLAASPD